jgi:hypothetical protein
MKPNGFDRPRRKNGIPGPGDRFGDFFRRNGHAPAEIAVGVLTALLDGPFFLWLLLDRASSRGEASFSS